MAETDAHAFSGDEIPAESSVIEVRLRELKQLFDSLDPSPFKLTFGRWPHILIGHIMLKTNDFPPAAGIEIPLPRRTRDV